MYTLFLVSFSLFQAANLHHVVPFLLLQHNSWIFFCFYANSEGMLLGVIFISRIDRTLLMQGFQAWNKGTYGWCIPRILICLIDNQTDECAHEWADRRMGNCSLETIGTFVSLIRSQRSAVYALATGTQQPIRTLEMIFSRRARNNHFLLLSVVICVKSWKIWQKTYSIPQVRFDKNGYYWEETYDASYVRFVTIHFISILWSHGNIES